MAKSIKDIYKEIVDEKDSLTNIQAIAPTGDSVDQLNTDLNSGSKVSIWRLFAYLIALAHHTQQFLWDLFKVEIEAIVANAPTGTLPWYQLQVLKFQYGDTLTFFNEKYIYPTIDESKKIVKLCAVEDRADGVVIIKVASLSNNLPTPLSTIEKTALEAYVFKIRFAGTKFSIVSTAPDLLKFLGTIFYDPTIPLSTVQQNVETAIDLYLKNLPFNGVFKINALIDVIQAVQGVTDVTVGSIEAKYGALTYSPITRTYTAQAGYISIDPSNPLSATLVYSPSIL